MSAHRKKKARQKSDPQAEFWGAEEADFGAPAPVPTPETPDGPTEATAPGEHPVEALQEPSSKAPNEEPTAPADRQETGSEALELPAIGIPELELANESPKAVDDPARVDEQPKDAVTPAKPPVEAVQDFSFNLRGEKPTASDEAEEGVRNQNLELPTIDIPELELANEGPKAVDDPASAVEQPKSAVAPTEPPLEPVQEPRLNAVNAQDEKPSASNTAKDTRSGKLELPAPRVHERKLGSEAQRLRLRLRHATPLRESPANPAPAASHQTPTSPSASQPRPCKPTRSLVISIHDVSQHSLPAVERILAELETLGVRGACSLLVVPDHHRQGTFLDDPFFCNWLKERAAIGDEVVIHGYHHCRNPQPDESFREKLTTRIYTKGEGEFFDIQGADALRIVSEGRQELRTIGLAPRGFIAPAWLLSDGAESALRVLKMDYTTRLTSVEDLVSGQLYRSQTLVWSVRALWRRVVSLGWNALLFRRLRSNPLMRISIHPTDIEHRAIWRQVLKLVRLALVNRTPISYLKWVETSRHSAHANQS